MKYKYTSFLPPMGGSKWTKRPLIQIEILGKNPRKFNALIDSGADQSLFNIEIAKVIGLDLSKAKKHSFIGISGKQPVSAYLLDNVSIKVDGMEKAIKIPIGFIDSDSVDLLLGQEGFFDQFKIKFEKDHDSFELTQIKK